MMMTVGTKIVVLALDFLKLLAESEREGLTWAA